MVSHLDMRELLAQIAGDNAVLAADPDRVAQLRRWYSQIGAAALEQPELADPATFRRWAQQHSLQEPVSPDSDYRGWV